MEREMNKNEEQLMDLMTVKSFNELSVEEESFVLNQTTKEEYELDRKVILGSVSMNDDLVPLPLILPETKKAKGIVIPLYQSAAAVAAAIVISFFVFRSNEVIIKEVKVPAVASADTVYIENSRVDTVVEREIQFIDKIIYRDNETARKQIASCVSIEVPKLNSSEIVNKGQTLRNDETFTLVEKLMVETPIGM